MGVSSKPCSVNSRSAMSSSFRRLVPGGRPRRAVLCALPRRLPAAARGSARTMELTRPVLQALNVSQGDVNIRRIRHPVTFLEDPAVAAAGSPLPLVEQFQYGLAAPICLTWELTYACNLACVHCLSSSGRRDL